MSRGHSGCVQDLLENELGKVFKSGLHLPDWAVLRLVSKQWKALADSCADCVSVCLTDAECQKIDWCWDRACAVKAVFSRLRYVL